MGYRFNPPPGWPPPPPGWVPPAGWQPDPSWPPPPDDWELWVFDDADDPREPETTGGSSVSGDDGDHPADGRSREKPAGRAQTIALIVAVLGMLGSTLSVLVGDYLEDRRRMEQELRLVYTALRVSALDFEKVAAKEVLESLHAAIQNIQSDLPDQELLSKLDEADETLKTALDALDQSYRTVQGKLDDVRLLGSRPAIDAAWEMNEAAGRRYNHLIDLNNRFAQVHSRILDAASNHNLKSKDLKLPKELADLAHRDTWDKQQTHIALCERTEAYFSLVEEEINARQMSHVTVRCR